MRYENKIDFSPTFEGFCNFYAQKFSIYIH